jgi:hypothetical protein
LRVADLEEILRLPTLFGAVREQPIALNSTIWGAVPSERRTLWHNFTMGQLTTQFFKPVVGRAMEGANYSKVNGHLLKSLSP